VRSSGRAVVQRKANRSSRSSISRAAANCLPTVCVIVTVSFDCQLIRPFNGSLWGPKKTWREIVERDCRARGLNREDCSRWRKQIGMIDYHDECEWVNVSSRTSSPWLFRTKSREP